MEENKIRRDEELARLYEVLGTLDPLTDEYSKVHAEILKIEEKTIEHKKVDDAANDEKKNRIVQVATFGAGLVITPVIGLLCKRNLAKYIGKVEQFETFTSSAGRSISSWFKF